MMDEVLLSIHDLTSLCFCNSARWLFFADAAAAGAGIRNEGVDVRRLERYLM